MTRRRVPRTVSLVALAAALTLLLNGLLPVPDLARAAANPSLLYLPRVPWEGGPAYWSSFPKARAAGWSADTFFPVVVWYGSCISPEQMAFDKAYGVNTYAHCNSAASYEDIRRAGMFTLFTPAGQPPDAVQTQQVGTVLEDEVDGRFEPADGVAFMQSLARQYAPETTGRFTYANWTSGIVTYDRTMDFSTDYYDTVNVNSIDQYFYSVPHCTDMPLRWRTPAVSSHSSGRTGATIDRAGCRTSNSYGKIIDLQLEVNAARGTSGPVWAMLETVGIGYRKDGAIGRQQAEGMAVASLIHEARGLVWFSQSFDHDPWNSDNPCGSGDSFSSIRNFPTSYPCADAMAGVQAAGLLVRQYARVLNTQSYVWDFGPGTDTMLKVLGRDAYVFAMSDAGPGSRTFSVPGGLASEVQVLGENRTIPIRNSTFTDSFADESSYHIYKIPLKARAARG